MLNSEYKVLETAKKIGCMQAAITHRNPHFSLIGFYPKPLALGHPIKIELTARLSLSVGISYPKVQVLSFSNPPPVPHGARARLEAQPHTQGAGNSIASRIAKRSNRRVSWTLQLHLCSLLVLRYYFAYPESPQHRLPEPGLR